MSSTDQIVATLKGGDVVGEIALISNSPRTATVRAKTSLDAVTVSRQAFGHLLAHVPGVKQTMEGIMHRHVSSNATPPPEVAASTADRNGP